MRTVLSYTGPHRFFGRREGSFFTGCPWRELFALSFPPSDIPLLLENLLAVKMQLLDGQLKRGGGWEFYERMHGMTGDHFTTIDDFTDDFDFPEDYELWMKHYKNPLHRMLVPVYGPAIKSWGWRIERWKKALRPGKRT